MAGPVPYGCGQCLPCRVNSRRLWTWRQFLESLCHEESSFITLTYSDDHLPGPPSVDPDSLRLFIGRLRENVFRLTGSRLRYYAVGEYGDHSWRPHYHLNVFGMGPSLESIVQRCWPYGYSYTAEFNEFTAQYVGGYVTKKLSSWDSRGLPVGLHPEFARMSRKPGLGAPAMSIIAEALDGPAGRGEVSFARDVPYRLRTGKRSVPLGRYLRSKLRELTEFPDHLVERNKRDFAFEKAFELSLLSDDPKLASITSPKARYIQSTLGQIRSIEVRHKISHSRKL